MTAFHVIYYASRQVSPQWLLKSDLGDEHRFAKSVSTYSGIVFSVYAQAITIRSYIHETSLSAVS